MNDFNRTQSIEPNQSRDTTPNQSIDDGSQQAQRTMEATTGDQQVRPEARSVADANPEADLVVSGSAEREFVGLDVWDERDANGAGSRGHEIFVGPYSIGGEDVIAPDGSATNFIELNGERYHSSIDDLPPGTVETEEIRGTVVGFADTSASSTPPQGR